IKFLIVAFAIFWVVKALARLRLDTLGKADAKPTPTEVLLTEIRDELRAGRAGAGGA
ncbi:MAG: MscL family protein, partial [Acetobacteraceae bacterium]|nr:MscL family protein [Acetobacteraceae bacterium]